MKILAVGGAILLTAVFLVNQIFVFSVRENQYQLSLQSIGAMESQTIPGMRFEVTANGTIGVSRPVLSRTNIAILYPNIRLTISQNSQTSLESDRNVARWVNRPHFIKLNEEDSPKEIFFSAEIMDDPSGEVGANVVKLLVHALFPPKITGLAPSIWAPAQHSFHCSHAGCNAQANSTTASLTQKIRWTWTPSDLPPKSINSTQEQTVTHVLFSSSTKNILSFKFLSTTNALNTNVYLGKKNFSAQIETDGKRNKIRALKREFLGDSAKQHLTRIIDPSLAEKKPTEIYRAIEAGLLLYPEISKKLSALYLDKNCAESVCVAIGTALLRVQDPVVEATAQQLFIDPRASDRIETLLFLLQPNPGFSPRWFTVLEKLARMYPQLSDRILLTSCSLARELANPAPIEYLWKEETANLTANELGNRVACIGNAGFSESVPFLREVFLSSDSNLRSNVVFSLRFLSNLDPIVLESLLDSDLAARSLDVIEFRVMNGLPIDGAFTAVQKMPKVLFQGNSYLRERQAVIMKKLGSAQ